MSELVARARSEGTPLIDGDSATFVWHGPNAPTLLGDFNRWGWGDEATVLSSVEWEVWAATIPFPRDAYIEYVYRDGEATVLDPFNRRSTSDGIGGRHNFFHMPEATPTQLSRSRVGVPRGTVTRFEARSGYLITGGKRTLHLYQPPTDDPVPLLVVFDGDEYLRRARLPQILDNLIDQGRIRPIAVAFVNHGRQARFVEYMCNDATLGFLFVEVLPLALQHLNLIDINEQPGSYGVCGASMGGLIALYAGVRAPEVFGHVLSQSGTFAFDLIGERTLVRELIERDAGAPIPTYLSVSQYEMLQESNRHMRDLLLEKGYSLTYREHNGGHNYPSWRDDVWRGLEVLFPPIS